jgi:hypothetical protein
LLYIQVFLAVSNADGVASAIQEVNIHANSISPICVVSSFVGVTGNHNVDLKFASKRQLLFVSVLEPPKRAFENGDNDNISMAG